MFYDTERLRSIEGAPDVEHIIQVEDFEPFIGSEAIARIQTKARTLHDIKVVNFNSTYYGGGVAEMLSSLSLLMNRLGVKTEWRVIQGTPDFFSITKKMHNALQGGDINLTDLKLQIYEAVVNGAATLTCLGPTRDSGPTWAGSSQSMMRRSSVAASMPNVSRRHSSFSCRPSIPSRSRIGG
jgi:hypothetical protein